MANVTSPLINPKDIVPGKAIIIDARGGPDAFQRYQAGHLKGAIHADLDKDLSQKPADAAVGGRHPLPDITAFSTFVGTLGISPESDVIVYDDKNGANAAARFWWMMRALGHKNIKVVDGGLDAIIRHGLPMESGDEKPTSTKPYPAKAWTMPTVEIDAVQLAVKNPDALVIDVREGYRYRGEREPIDLIAGHIPGAINIPYLENLAEDGTFRPAEALAKIYNKALDFREPSQVIVHCGSGVTACHTLLALEQAGIKGASLYVGSWSEWSRRDLPVATGVSDQASSK